MTQQSSQGDQQGGIGTPKLLLIAATLVITWGTAFSLVTVAVRYMPPIWLVALRTFIGALFLVAYAYLRGHRLPPLRDVRWRWYGGLCLTGMVFPFFLTASGQKTVDSGISAIITSMMPLITIILAHFFASERLTPRKTVGFFVGFLGIVVLFLPDDFNLGLVADWRAQTLILGAATCYAITTVAIKHAPETPPSLGSAMMVICAALISITVAGFSGLPTEPIAWKGWAAIIGLGIGSTGFATILYLFVVAQSGPSTLAKINYFPPLAAVASGVLFLGEPFTWRIVVAFITILIGLIIARPKRSRKQLAPQVP